MALPPAGYCRHCHRLIPLDRRGRLEPHHASSASLVPVTCMGGRTAPPTDPPTEVASLAFADEPPTVVCTECGETVIERYRDPGYPIPHGPRGPQGTYCKGSWVSTLYSDSPAPVS